MNLNNFFVILFIVLLLAPATIATGSKGVSYNDKNTLDLAVTINNSFKIVPTDKSYSIKYVNASVSSYPRNDNRQVVTEIMTEPSASGETANGDTLNFFYTGSLKEEYGLRITSNVKTRYAIEEIKNTVDFPLKDLDSSMYAYLEPDEIIDINSDIKNLASELIGDKTDLYEIEYVFAEFVRKNVAYDMSTLTSSANQKSSWVLENKRGVCDEITNLFISLNRAVGIPTRFVSGTSYTDLDSIFGSSWVSHAWAEVYYPGVGWVPYDVTYGQYGFIDAGHIKMSDSAKSYTSNIDYNYLGNNIKLVPGSIGIGVKVLNYGENVRGSYNFDTTINSKNVGFGSYNLIVVDVKNSKNYYQVADLYLAETEGIKIIGDSKETLFNKTVYRKEVLLKPYSISEAYWIIKLDSNMESKYTYTFPITVYNGYNETSTAFLSSSKEYNYFELKYFEDIINSKLEESEKVYSKSIVLECLSDKSNMYLEDTVNINCVLDNVGEKSFDNVAICLDTGCINRSLAIQKINLNFSKKFDTEGLKTIEVKAYNKLFSKTNYVSVNVLDKPNVIISEIKSPEIVNYGQPFDILFTLDKNSKSLPKNITIVVKSETAYIEWTLPELEGQRTFELKSNGDTLKPNTNNYNIVVTYYDEKGKAYTVESDFIIQSDAKWYENILLFFNLVGRDIAQSVS